MNIISVNLAAIIQTRPGGVLYEVVVTYLCVVSYEWRLLTNVLNIQSEAWTFGEPRFRGTGVYPGQLEKNFFYVYLSFRPTSSFARKKHKNFLLGVFFNLPSTPDTYFEWQQVYYLLTTKK